MKIAGRPILVVGTSNPSKAAEFGALLSGLDLEIAALADSAALVPVDESGDSLEANARLKACAYARQLGAAVLADDTGLEVDALAGAPGLHSARYAGPNAAAEANRRRLLAELGDLPPERRQARFVCCLSLADSNGEIIAEARGWCRGRITTAARGSRGFGYDTLFEIVEYGRTLAELTPATVECLGHRGRAVRALMPAVRAWLAR